MKQLFILLTIIGLICVSFALADPIAPTTLSQISSSTRSLISGNRTQNASAGYVTELRIEGFAQITEGWQGYFGNISGEVVLDDADNNTLYSWSISSPGGEILAVRNASVDWSSGQVLCANSTHIGAENALLFPGTNGDDVDNLTNTFNLTTHPSFTIGVTTFTADECGYTVATNENDAPQINRLFNETLLYSNNTDTIIYTSLLNPSADGFKTGTNDKFDFQMLVGEDGHGNSDTTQYFFFVELNP